MKKNVPSFTIYETAVKNYVYTDAPGQKPSPGRALSWCLRNIPGILTYPLRAVLWYGSTLKRNRDLEAQCDEVSLRLEAYQDKLDEEWGKREGHYSPDGGPVCDY